MIQGTGSDVGKSLLVAGLCRAFRNRGLKVAPFKPQNMSNNAAVAADGGEIGRAQALQAKAAGLPLSRHMNPVLLKPQSDRGAQVVVQGKVLTSSDAADYQRLKPTLLPAVLESFARIGEGRDLVVVEGAGSPAEVNLRAGDIANMGFAEAADVPVILAGDIERGGVIAQLVGTEVLLTAAERQRIKGFIVNKFRGDPALFDGGMKIIEARTGWAPIGLVPWFAGAAALPAEDSVSLMNGRKKDAKVRIAVPMLSRIANFDDFDPLAAEPAVDLAFIPPGRPLPADADLVILPGSKATLADLAFLRAQGWDIDLLAHHRRGGQILGICGGYQMLGTDVADPDGIEGEPGSAPGLGLLAVRTVMGRDKTLVAVDGICLEERIHGFEMHMGVTEGPDRARPFCRLQGQPDGAVSADGSVMGGYLHGLFAADGFRRRFLDRLKRGAASDLAYEAKVEATLDELAAHLEAHLDLDRLLALSYIASQSRRTP
jgi:adenosylcobyric acid synthase